MNNVSSHLKVAERTNFDADTHTFCIEKDTMSVGVDSGGNENTDSVRNAQGNEISVSMGDADGNDNNNISGNADGNENSNSACSTDGDGILDSDLSANGDGNPDSAGITDIYLNADLDVDIGDDDNAVCDLRRNSSKNYLEHPRCAINSSFDNLCTFFVRTFSMTTQETSSLTKKRFLFTLILTQYHFPSVPLRCWGTTTLHEHTALVKTVSCRKCGQ